MDILYVVNPGSQDIRYGTPFTGALTSILPLGFAGYRIAAMPGQRYLYVTGNKSVDGVRHAWLAVVDTCTNTVTTEVDLGIGFAAQCAVPDAVGGNRAYVAISQAVGSIDTGPQGGSNRVEVLNVSNQAAPIQLSGTITPPSNSPWGLLYIVWSHTLNTLYTSHRGDLKIFYFTPAGGQAGLQSISVGNEQPMGVGISNDGLTLFITRRTGGDLREVDLTAQVPVLGPPIQLPNADTSAGMFITVTTQDQVLVTSTRQDGFLNIFQHQRPPAAVPQIQSIDTMGSLLGQPAVNADTTVAYVPRGNQNDVAQVDLANGTLFPGFLASGSFPSDVVVLRHEAGMTLQATPALVSAPCGIPIDIEVRAFDSCGQEMVGVPVQPSTFDSNISISPLLSQSTPTTFCVQCAQGGQAVVNFTATVFPFVSTSVNVQCNCLQNYCLDFSTFGGGPLPQAPGDLGGIIGVESVLQIHPSGPSVSGTVLKMFQGGVRFQVLPGHSIQNLTIRLTRHDLFSPNERVIVTHTGGVTTVPGPGLSRGDFDIVCPFNGITEWTIFGGQETLINEICFMA